MRRLVLSVLAALILVGLSTPTPAEAGLFRRRVNVVAPSACSGPTCGNVAAGYAPAPQVTYQASYATFQGSYAQVQTAPSGGGAGDFLAALNAWRSLHGRPSLGWDAALAAYAASNSGVHAPGSSGGAGQCWAGVRDFRQALEMWKTSPAHAAILLNARSSVGVSVCPTGTTCNAR